MSWTPNHGATSNPIESIELNKIVTLFMNQHLIGKSLNDIIAMYKVPPYQCKMNHSTKLCPGYLIFDSIEMVCTSTDNNIMHLQITRMLADKIFVITGYKNNRCFQRYVYYNECAFFCIEGDIIEVRLSDVECSPVYERQLLNHEGWSIISHPNVQCDTRLKLAFHQHTNYYACMCCNTLFNSLKQWFEHFNLPPVFYTDELKKYDPVTHEWSKIKINLTSDINKDKQMQEIFDATIMSKIQHYYDEVLRTDPERVNHGCDICENDDIIADIDDEYLLY